MVSLSTLGSWALIVYLLGGIGFLIHRFTPGGDDV